MLDWKEIWCSCREYLRETLEPTAFHTFIGPLQPDSKGNTLMLFAPNSYVARMVVSKYISIIESAPALRAPDFDLSAHKLQVQVGEAEVPGDPSRPPSKASSASQPLEARPSPWQPEPAPDTSLFAMGQNGVSGYLNAHHTFENFQVGASNEQAHTAAVSVTQSLLQSCGADSAEAMSANMCSPMVFYGANGVGKTHLMQAIASRLVDAGIENVRYESSNDITKAITGALQHRNIEELLNNYASLKVLLLDDVHLLCSRTKTREEVFHLLNKLTARGSYLIAACDCAPAYLKNFEERLTSRLVSGTVVAMTAPEVDTKAAILMSLAEKRGRSLKLDVAMKIAERMAPTDTARELMGLINHCCIGFDARQGRPISLHEAEKVLREATGPVRVSTEAIQKTVATYYHVDVKALLSKSRKRNNTRPRQVAMWLCRNLTNASYPEIGEAFGGKNHSTAMHACKKVTALQGTCTIMREDIRSLSKQLTSGNSGSPV